MYSPPPTDADTERMTRAHRSSASALGVTIVGPPVWGWHGRTLGRRALHSEHGLCWLRLLSAPAGEAGGKLWEGTALAAGLFPGVHKPELHALHDQQGDGHAYRAELTSYVTAPVLSPDPVLRQELDLPDQVLESLRRDTHTISQAVTDRVAVRQQWIDRRIPELTGQTAPQIRTWECAHGDLHPANITQNATILDWEGFGLAPRGYDAAMLYAYSLLAPRTADRIHDAFAPVLDTPDGRDALLVVTADLLLSASRGDHPDLVPDLSALARRCASTPRP